MRLVRVGMETGRIADNTSRAAVSIPNTSRVPVSLPSLFPSPSSRICGHLATPAMGKLAHEPGKTAATRAKVRYLRRWLREILPACANATSTQFAVHRTEHAETVARQSPRQFCPPIGRPLFLLVQGLQYNRFWRYNLFCSKEARR